MSIRLTLTPAIRATPLPLGEGAGGEGKPMRYLMNHRMPDVAQELTCPGMGIAPICVMKPSVSP